MIRLDDLSLFVRTAALGSFSNAAREANLLPGQVSAAIQRLERDLDIRLFARSTRSLRLTPEGERYLPYARQVLTTLEQGQALLHGDGGELQGTLQIAAPSDLGRNVLLPWITEFRETHPKLVLRLLVSDFVTDIFRDPVDVAIRYGQAQDASYVCLPLAPENRRILVASPGYLKKHGRPRSIEELSKHQCLLYVLNSAVYDRWVFGEGKDRKEVAVSGNYICDDAELVHRWAVAGQGIAYKSWLDVHEDVRAKRLEVVLPEHGSTPTPLNFICPHRKQFLPAVRQLYELLERRCARISALMPR